MPSSHGIFIEIIGDSKSYLKAAESTVAANTKMEASFKQVALNATTSAEAQVAASTKAIEAQRAQVSALEAVAAKQVAGSDAQIAANVAVAESQAKLNRSLGLSSVAMGRTGTAAKTAEVDLNKIVRGGLAGSGAFSALGRSLAFASSGFIAFAAGATLIAQSISAARELAVAQRQINTQLRESGRSWAVYGGQIDKVIGHLTKLAGFTHTELLSSFSFAVRATNNVSNSLKLLSIASDVARGRNIPLQAAMLALTKAVGGSATALRRLGIIVPKTAKGWDAINFVAQKFAGQAKAGTTAAERFGAILNRTEEIIGVALLPTVNRLLTSFGNWLDKINKTGELQKDVNEAVKFGGDVFHTLGGAIKDVDKVTGSLLHTIEILATLKFASIITKTWIPALVSLAAKFGLVKTAAAEAAAAETAAGAGGGAAAGAGFGLVSGPGAVVASSVAITALATNAFLASTGPSHVAGGSQNTVLVEGVGLFQKRGDKWYRVGGRAGVVVASAAQAAQAQTILTAGVGIPANTSSDFGQPGGSRFGRPGLGAGFGAAGPPAVFTSFTDRIANVLAQTRAQFTKGMADDVAAAKAEIAFIKKMIAKGRFKGQPQALNQALQAELQALGVIQAAAAAAAQRAAAKAQAAAAAFTAKVDPLGLEVSLLTAEAAGASTIPALKKLLAAARSALAVAKNLKQREEALQQIISVQQAIATAQQTATAVFTASAKLLLDIARDQALGRSIVDDLKEEKKALFKWIRSHRKNIQGVTDAYNQITAINQQLQSQINAGIASFKLASTKALTAGLGLTADQRRALRARLSQLGPGGTTPGSGTGAGGYAINPDTGRPIHVHTTVNLDKQKVGESVTRHQQKHRRRNPHQRRGPNAATA